LKQIDELALSHHGLRMNRRGDLDTESDAGKACCAKFLGLLAVAAAKLGAEGADRYYRKGFTMNYLTLFPDSARRYRVDILESSLECQDCFWVNGDHYKLCEKVLHAAGSLANVWRELGDMLASWLRQGNRCQIPFVKELLGKLDHAWAHFEHSYICELIKIEEKARRIVLEVIELDWKLCCTEAAFGEVSQESRQARMQLSSVLAHINSTANTRRKGRTDLRSDILDRAVEICSTTSDKSDAGYVVAKSVVDAFHALRRYFQQAERCLEMINPYLENNAGLVASLVEYEKSWEVAARYLGEASSLSTLRLTVSRLQVLRLSEPAFDAMCEDCDAELFMVLPRLMWLFFVQNPAQHAAMISGMLPDCFTLVDATLEPDAKLERFVQRFHLLAYSLSEQACRIPGSIWLANSVPGRDSYEEIVVARPIRGAESEGDSSSLGALLVESLRGFMRELEGWSMQLQRHCPDDWNRCSAVLLRCLSQGPSTGA